MRNPAETLAAIKAALDNPSPELAAVPGALAYMRADYEWCQSCLYHSVMNGKHETRIARIAAALGIEVQP